MCNSIECFIKSGSMFLFLLLMTIVFVSCTHTLTRVENKLGPPAKVEKLNNTTTYYYYYYPKRRGTLVLEYTANSKGEIINAREYIKQQPQ